MVAKKKIMVGGVFGSTMRVCGASKATTTRQDADISERFGSTMRFPGAAGRHRWWVRDREVLCLPTPAAESARRGVISGQRAASDLAVELKQGQARKSVAAGVAPVVAVLRGLEPSFGSVKALDGCYTEHNRTKIHTPATIFSAGGRTELPLPRHTPHEELFRAIEKTIVVGSGFH